MEKLKPCPVCGMQPYVYEDYSSEDNKYRWSIDCLNDNCPGYIVHGPWRVESVSTGWCNSKEEAIMKWNRKSR